MNTNSSDQIFEKIIYDITLFRLRSILIDLMLKIFHKLCIKSQKYHICGGGISITAHKRALDGHINVTSRDSPFQGLPPNAYPMAANRCAGGETEEIVHGGRF